MEWFRIFFQEVDPTSIPILIGALVALILAIKVAFSKNGAQIYGMVGLAILAYGGAYAAGMIN